MKLLKQITAVMAALLIVVNVSFINTSAAMAAPVMAGEELASFLAGALGASGHSQSEIDNLTIPDQLDLLGNDLRNGNISLDTPVTYETNIDGINQSVSVPFDAYMGMSKDTPFFNPPVYALNWYKEAVNDFMSDYNVLSNSESYFELTNDMNGYGVKMIVTSNNTRQIWYGDYIVLYSNPNNPEQFYARMFGGLFFENYKQNPDTKIFELQYTEGRDGDARISSSSDDFFGKINSGFYQITGDVRYTLDSPALPDFEVDNECRVGTLPDGTVVTPDMLNPDGTVTVDGVTYDPVDYLDPDNLTDEGKHALIDAIADAISNTLVVADDKPIVDEDDITVEVAEDLENYTVPTGIITVFPFCLPFDFVRGMKLFSAKPVTPHFEVTINVPAILNIPEQKWTFVIDLGEFETLAKITRWTSLIGFCYLLISLSTKIVKGAGA